MLLAATNRCCRQASDSARVVALGSFLVAIVRASVVGAQANGWTILYRSCEVPASHVPTRP